MFKVGDQVFNTIAVAWDAGQTDCFEIGTVFEVISEIPSKFTDGGEGIWVRELSSLRQMMLPTEYIMINNKITRLLYLGQ